MPNATQHTPGPWMVRSDTSGWIEVHAPSLVATRRICTLSNETSAEHANARLIAAAPALLDALRAMVNEAEVDARFLTDATYRRMVKAARAALRLVDGAA